MTLVWVERCARCYLPGVAIVYRRRTPIDIVLRRPRRSYRVCLNHIPGRSPR